MATAWTKYDELTPEERLRFGGYVRARDEARAQAKHNAEQRKLAEDALVATGGDKVAALGLMLSAGAVKASGRRAA